MNELLTVVERATVNDTHYVLLKNGELWIYGETGKKHPSSFRCGFVSSPDRMMEAIENHEEEVRVLYEQMKCEFGIS
jgi:hypothetical protein